LRGLRSLILPGILCILIMASSSREPISSNTRTGLLLTGSSSIVLVGIRTPVAEIILCVVEDLSGLRSAFIGRTDIAWDDGGVV
jgi:hypothetical protein